jgi:hypothetical protein
MDNYNKNNIVIPEEKDTDKTIINSVIDDTKPITQLHPNRIPETIPKSGLCKPLGYLCGIVHFIYMCLILFMVVFTTNISYLCICTIIISINVIAIVVFHGCPLTLLEKKYLGKSVSNPIYHITKSTGILYECNHDYEKALMLLIAAWLVCTIKCMTIMFLKTFNYKLHNCNNIYGGE